MNRERIIPNEDVTRIHGSANFGSRTPREVIDRGIVQIASGYSVGSTLKGILISHDLISNKLVLTHKGQQYLWSIFKDVYINMDLVN